MGISCSGVSLMRESRFLSVMEFTLVSPYASLEGLVYNRLAAGICIGLCRRMWFGGRGGLSQGALSISQGFIPAGIVGHIQSNRNWRTQRKSFTYIGWDLNPQTRRFGITLLPNESPCAHIISSSVIRPFLVSVTFKTIIFPCWKKGYHCCNPNP